MIRYLNFEVLHGVKLASHYLSRNLLLTSYKFQGEVEAWIIFQKKKWEFQRLQREKRAKRVRTDGYLTLGNASGRADAGRIVRSGPTTTLGGFLRRTQRTLMDVPWQIIQV